MIDNEYIKSLEKTIIEIKRRSKNDFFKANKHISTAKFNKDFPKSDTAINDMIDSYIISHRGKTYETTVYDDVISYLTRLNKQLDNSFVRKNGAINESRFYDYAYIDKSTWSSMKNNQIVPSKKTILKLAIALRLNEDETIALLQKAKEKFDYNDTQELVILALINMKVYDIPTVIETLEFYQYNSSPFFDSIYDTAEEQSRKRREYEARKKEETKKKISELMKNT